jgi:type I site-specific restriction endonuclease
LVSSCSPFVNSETGKGLPPDQDRVIETRPKRTINANTYAYFGEPVYIYSLKEGINDGFLTPFKVKQIGSSQ